MRGSGPMAARPEGRGAHRRFSANLGFLWRDRPLVERISRAAAVGFDAVELHDDWEHEEPARLAAAVRAAGLPVMAINTRMGETCGVAANPAAADEARADIDRAAAMAGRLGAKAIHVLAGDRVPAEPGDARAAFLAALTHALETFGGTVLIEPISPAARPGYALARLDEAAAIVAEIGSERLRVLVDAYHLAATEAHPFAAFARHAVAVGHVQIASHPARAEPDTVCLMLMAEMEDVGWAGVYGCEYHPVASVEAGLGWRRSAAWLER